MVGLGLVFCFLIGIVYGANRFLGIRFSYSPLAAISLTGCLLFVFSMFGILKPGTFFLLYFGYFLFFIALIDFLKNRDEFSIGGIQFIVFAGLIFLCYILTLKMKFTVDDDYVYWGIIGKYLYSFDHLPDKDTTIINRHLAYTPGTGLFHYLFYQMFGTYNQAISYFAQAVLLICALFVLIKEQFMKKSLILLFVLIVLMSIFSGSVFTKLQVDYLLSIYFFAVLWICYNEKPDLKILMIITFPLCFLFLIKEIGFVMGMALLSVFVIDLLLNADMDFKEKIRTCLFITISAGLLFLLRYAWSHHCSIMGFSQFNASVNFESIQASLQFFSNERSQRGLFLFVKELLVGPADRLNLPYLCWYAILLYLGITIYRQEAGRKRKRYLCFAGVLAITCMLYYVMLYFLQVIVFGVGGAQHHTVGLTRYANILFSPVLYFISMLYGYHWLSKKNISLKTVLCSLGVVLLLLCLSRVETTIRRETQYEMAEQIAEKIETRIGTGQSHRIAVIPGTDREYLWIRFLYHLLPARINHGGFPAETKDKLVNNLKDYDYVFFFRPGPAMKERLVSLIGQDFNDQGFYQIGPEKPDDKSGKGIILTKVF